MGRLRARRCWVNTGRCPTGCGGFVRPVRPALPGRAPHFPHASLRWRAVCCGWVRFVPHSLALLPSICETEAQRSGFGFERRSSGTTELSRLRGSEGCAACDDATASSTSRRWVLSRYVSGCINLFQPPCRALKRLMNRAAMAPAMMQTLFIIQALVLAAKLLKGIMTIVAAITMPRMAWKATA